jgi:hypothetical protein
LCLHQYMLEMIYELRFRRAEAPLENDRDVHMISQKVDRHDIVL